MTNKRKLILGIVFVIFCSLFVFVGCLIAIGRNTHQNYNIGVVLGYLLSLITIITCITLDNLIPTKKESK